MCKDINSINVLGSKLLACCIDPLTGYFRDGYCRTNSTDIGEHIVCALMSKKFLTYSKIMGNDLITPVPEYDFKGLKEGDHWCLCADRWIEALRNDCAPQILLEGTDKKILEKVDFDTLKKYSIEYKNLN